MPAYSTHKQSLNQQFPKPDFEKINEAAQANPEGWWFALFPNGKKSGQHYVIGNFAGDAGDSLKYTPALGVCKDFGSDEKGCDAIGTVTKAKGFQHQSEGAKWLNDVLNAGAVSGPTPKTAPRYKTKKVVPETQPLLVAPSVPTADAFRLPPYGAPVTVWPYLNAEGNPVGVVARYIKEDGEKDIRPWIWNGAKWECKGFGENRPLYGLDQLAARPETEVLLTEGEKAADAARVLFPECVVLTWQGGTGGVNKADWSPLKERQVTMWPDADEPGRKAAHAIQKTLPEMRVVNTSDLPEKWDLADPIPEGVDVRALFLEAQKPEPIPANLVLLDLLEAAPEPEIEAAFDILGNDGDGGFYYFNHVSKNVLRLPAKGHTKLELLQLQTLKYWNQEKFRGHDGKPDWLEIANFLIQPGQRKRYNPAKIRGRGAWLDDGRLVMHLGSSLRIDGETADVGDIRSAYTYPARDEIRLGAGGGMTAEESARLLPLLRFFRFKDPLDAELLAGWIVCATVCGALDWRPHVWLSGASGAGKSTLIEKIVTPLLGDFAFSCKSETSAAGIRQGLKCDALPVVFDEAETETEHDIRRMQAVLNLARQASSEGGGHIRKGTQAGVGMDFTIRSAFLFASIGVAASSRADCSRLTVMEMLKQGANPDGLRQMLAAVSKTSGNPKWADAFRARVVSLAKELRDSTPHFVHAIAVRLKGQQRDADQLGALAAGAWICANDHAATVRDAELWASSKDWREVKDKEAELDEIMALTRLLQHLVKVDLTGGDFRQISVGELIREAIDLRGTPDRQTRVAEMLGRIGITVTEAGVNIANKHAMLSEAFKGTPYAEKWADQLKRIDGAAERVTPRIMGQPVRCTRLPLAVFPDDQQIPLL
jgi:putative DNA primase/helicase